MNIVVEDSGPCRKVLKVEVPAGSVREEYDALVGEYAHGARIPGFRPGRAPAAVVARRYAAELRKDAQERLISRAYRAALAESKIQPLEILDLTPDPLDKTDAAWNVSFSVEVAPAFDMPVYKGIALKRNPVEITDADVDTVLEDLRRRNGKHEDLSAGVAAADDLVAIDFTATIDGRPLEEVVPEAKGLGQAENFWTHLGEYATLPGFVEPFLGAAIGDERTVDVTFPDDFTVAPVRGRSARYVAKVRGIRRLVPAAIDEAFLREWNVPTVEELRANLRRSLERSRESEEQRRLRHELIQQLLRAAPMDLPANELQRATEHAIHDLVGSLTRQGMKEDQVREQKDKVFETARQSASDQLRVRFLLERIAELEKIAADEAEVDRELEAIARLRNEEPGALRARIERTGGIEDLRRHILQRKVGDFLLANAKVEA